MESVFPLFIYIYQPVHPKGDQPWVFIGGTDAEAETPILWPPHAKSWLIGKDSDAGRDWGQEEKGTTEDETAGWHHRLDGHEFEWTPGVGDGQGGLVCCDSWGRKESDMTEQLNWIELNWTAYLMCQTYRAWVTFPIQVWSPSSVPPSRCIAFMDTALGPHSAVGPWTQSSSSLHLQAVNCTLGYWE